MSPYDDGRKEVNKESDMDREMNEKESLTAIHVKLTELKKEIDDIKNQIEELKTSFLNELTESAKSKFDSFRNYLADKLKT